MTEVISRKKRAFIILVVLIVSMLILSQLNWFWRLIYPLQYDNIIIINAEEYSIDPALVAAMIFVESKYITSASSHRGARGLMQIMPDTGFWIAEQLDISGFSEEMLYDPAINIMFGCWYISNLNQQFNEQLLVVLAAYNAGRGNVKKWLENNNWVGRNATLDDLPFEETRNYIKQVVAVYARYKKIYDFE
ncbi:MAG: lytic transglycosylase domain-containing protein [Halanaerobiales bacterium]